MTAASCILILGGRESKACSTPLSKGQKNVQLSDRELQLSGSDSLSRPTAAAQSQHKQLTDTARTHRNIQRACARLRDLHDMQLLHHMLPSL